MNLLDETLNHTTNGSKPKAGKWTIIVQVHELRGIKSQFGSGGIPRPVIHVNVWDQTKIINPKTQGFECKIEMSGKISIEMTEDEIDSGQILISIVDKHLFSSSHIGAYNFDISDLHARTNHEYYVKWFALTDTKSNPPRRTAQSLNQSRTV